jgi:hypothetical protein
MDVASFRAALETEQPQNGLSPPLQALWWTAKGDWNKAHETVQAHEDDPSCAWVHAHLHRVEGDLSNARYWYGRAQRPAATEPLEREWETIVEEMLRQDRTD